MINNKVFLVLVVGIAALLIIAVDALNSSILNNQSNKLHDELYKNGIEYHKKIFTDNSAIKKSIDNILNQTGDIGKRLDEQNKHYNTTADSNKKLLMIIDILSNKTGVPIIIDGNTTNISNINKIDTDNSKKLDNIIKLLKNLKPGTGGGSVVVNGGK